MGRGLMLMVMLVVMLLVVVVVMMVDLRGVVWYDRRGGREDVGGRGRSRRGRVALCHTGVGRHSYSRGERGSGGAGQALGQRLIVEEVGALVDEALDDCLIGASGCQGVHGGEIWSHQRGPETDGQVLTGHQVQLVVLTHPGGQREAVKLNLVHQWIKQIIKSFSPTFEK